jgi:hypothetical protein
MIWKLSSAPVSGSPFPCRTAADILSAMSIAAADAPKRHASELGEPRQRFLSRVVDHCLSDAYRTPEDFLRHFPPAALVGSLAQADSLRVRLLVSTTGTHEKIALKKSVASAAEDLDLALAEQTTTPAALIALYPADDKVRYLDPKKLWAFATEGDFHRVTVEDGTRHGHAAKRLAFIVDCALSEGLITLRDVADGMTFDEIAACLPVSDVREVLKHAHTIGRAGAPLTEDRFLDVVPLPALVSHVPLDRTWQHVVLDRVAAPAGFVEARSGAVAAPEPVPSSPEVDVPVTIDSAVEAEPPPVSQSTRVPDEDESRRRVLDRLKLIDRLPPGHAGLSTAILLSVESMYADLWAVSDDDEREACIRESFPNQTLLRTALLALIELLDPSVDTKDAIIRDADIAGLIKIVLFEERRRRDVAPPSPRSSQTRPKRTVPPPLPRNSSPSIPEGRSSIPPPLPAEVAKREA